MKTIRKIKMIRDKKPHKEPDETPPLQPLGISKILVLIAAIILTGYLAHTFGDKPDPLSNLTADEYKTLYINCILNSTCNIYLGPGAVDTCIKNCMRETVTNGTYTPAIDIKIISDTTSIP
jgi:hypothetical protein